MDRNLIMAVVLSIVVIFAYYAIFPPPKPPPPASQPPAQEQAAQGPAAAPQPAQAPVEGLTRPVPGAVPAPAPGAEPSARPAEAVVVRVDTPRYVARVDTLGGRLLSLQLKDYQVGKQHIDWGDLIPPLRRYIDKPEFDVTAPVELVRRDLTGRDPLAVHFADDPRLSAAFDRVVYAADRTELRLAGETAAPQTLRLVGKGEHGLTVVKTITFHADSYIVDYGVQVINYGDKPLLLRVQNVFGEGPVVPPVSSVARVHAGPIFREEGSVDTETAEDVAENLIVRKPDWIGITSPYFLTAVTPESPVSHAYFQAAKLPGGKADEPTWVAFYGVELPQVTLAPNNQLDSRFKLYMGPKKTAELAKFGHGLEASLDLTLDVLATPLLVMLRWFHGYTGNYGLAIILLTILVRVGLFPLTYKGMLSMKRMQKLQPKMQAIRERFKNDRERVNKEMMGLYKRYKINPLGGCLPILLQIPIFFALYSALMGAIELRHSPFIFWLTDLSAKDSLYVTPILMAASMFVQQRLTPSTLDPMQQRMMLFMPLVFVIFMFNFPAGLTLYWFTSNLLSIAQQLVLNRVNVPEPEERT